MEATTSPHKMEFVAGGAGGLGKALAKLLAAQGSHVTIFGRTKGPLEEAVKEIERSRLSDAQEIRFVVLDLSDSSQVDSAFREHERIPDTLYCAAGGNHAQNGFFVDITAEQVKACMNNNYYATAYPAKSVLDIWIEDDKKHKWKANARTNVRRIVIISSAAAFLGLPGSIAYTPAKAAVRALADTLRLEMLRYSSPASKYSVHISFPGDFISPGFYQEQNTKTALTKTMQGLKGSIEDLEKRYPSSEKVASLVLEAVKNEEYIICQDSLAASLLFTNMVGASPKRGLGIMDSVVGVVVSWFIWPVLRRRWEGMCKKDGELWRLEEHE
ncbi:unnamed protein product [Clonostachys byssicola]|uniref:NAD(P)-binding protein n=1 Tax=Clonostachys byssicola TaxID=160290 RepID=A0A9N9UJN4_9HYPO|nr:unnamed protein product [Clonostachys byssicola]